MPIKPVTIDRMQLFRNKLYKLYKIVFSVLSDINTIHNETELLSAMRGWR